MITLFQERLNELARQPGPEHEVAFAVWDDGDVHTMLYRQRIPLAVPGTVHTARQPHPPAVEAIGQPNDKVRIIVNQGADGRNANDPQVTGYVFSGNAWRIEPVAVIPLCSELFSRHKGVLETDVLAPRGVYIAGLGSVGCLIAAELAMAGVGNFDLQDHDRLEVGNIARHLATLNYVGRRKTNFIADYIHGKNPRAKVRTCDIKITWDALDLVRERVRRNNLTICATGDRESRRIVNTICIEEKKTAIYAGAMLPRAYGGQILVARPGAGPCYQCFLMALPNQARDEEISNAQQAAAIAYSDRPVPIEPGLAIDIAPISIMNTKLAITELLRGARTTLKSLESDLVAPLYFWLNRREVGTPYENLEPLGHGVDGFKILRWYGIDLRRNPACPVCSDEPQPPAGQGSGGATPEETNPFE